MRFEQLNHVYRSLRFRLTMWNTAVVLLTAVAALVALREGLRVTLVRETDQRLLEDSEEIALAIRELYPNLEQIREEIDRKALGHKAHGMFVRLLDPRDEVVLSTPNAPALGHADLSSSSALALTTVDNYRVARQDVRLSDGTVYRVRVGTSLDFVEQDVSRLTRIIMLVGSVILVLSPIGGYWLSGRAAAPLAAMHKTAERLRPSKLEERLQIRGTGDELDRLAATINGLLDRIAEYIGRHRQFVANAAHELRSPLAAIQSSAEVALNAARPAEEYQELLGEIVEECNELRVLINQLLALAEGEMSGSPKDLQPLSLGEIVTRSLEMFRGVAEEREISLRIGRLDSAVVNGQAGRLRQVLNNLLDNALKFNHNGGIVTVDLTSNTSNGEVTLRIADSGSGIPAEDLPHIFDRFYRGDKARQRDNPTRGSGLGLSICQAIVVAHGGVIAAESEPGKGAVFVVTLPVSATTG